MLTWILPSLFTGMKSMDKRILVILILLFTIYLIIMTVLVLKERTRRRLWKSTQGYRGSDKISDSISSAIYRMLKAFPVTRNYIEKLSYQFRLICPCDSTVIAGITTEAFLISFCLSFAILFLIFLMNPQLITLITASFGIVIINKEIVGRIANHFEITLDQEIQQLIENEIHNYYLNYRVDDALYQSLDYLSSNMKVAAGQIYELLLSDNKDTALEEYYENIPNKYLREFVSLCVGVSERGDQVVEGKFLFINNLENLYEQLEIEIDKLQRLRMEFAGVMLIVILPIFCIGIVKWFCISIKSSMEAFYYGKEGFMIDLVLLVLTSTVYVVMHKSAEYRSFHSSGHRWLYWFDGIHVIKKAMNNYCDKYASGQERLKRCLKNNGYNIKARHFVLRSFLLAGAIFMISIGVSIYLNHIGRERLLCVEDNEVPTISTAADEGQQGEITAVIENYTKRLVSQNYRSEFITKEKLIDQLRVGKPSFANSVYEALADEILYRASKYKAMHFGFIDLFIGIVISIITFYSPRVLLKFSATVTKDAMEDEVNQFNALIGMLIYDNSMTVKQILIEMESYAIVMKQSIKNCINEYSSGDVNALAQLKEEEPYPSFTRIVDNLLRCDDMPIYEAFHEVDIEREGFLSKRRLSNEKSIKRRATRAYLLAAVPLMLLFAYGIIPTLIASMNEISSTLDMLETVW